jgi:hypothetical protein
VIDDTGVERVVNINGLAATDILIRFEKMSNEASNNHLKQLEEIEKNASKNLIKMGKKLEKLEKQKNQQLPKLDQEIVKLEELLKIQDEKAANDQQIKQERKDNRVIFGEKWRNEQLAMWSEIATGDQAAIDRFRQSDKAKSANLTNTPTEELVKIAKDYRKNLPDR